MPRRCLSSFTFVLGLALLLAQPLLGSLSAARASRAHTAAGSLAVPSAAHATLAAGYGQLPLAFELNEGQTNSAVRFLAHGSGYTLFLSPDQAVLSLRRGAAAPGRLGLDAFTPAGSADTASVPTQMLGMAWLGANPHPAVTGERPLPGTVNYFIGNDPAQWHTNIPTYQQVRLHDVYPGVDLVYYGNQGQLEYDFVVAPGANPSAIQLGFSGAERLGVDLMGNLSLRLPGGAVQQDQPAIYQTVNGTRRIVSGGFTLAANQQVAFALGAYNPHLPLVIDPSYKFSTYLGGTGEDQILGLAVDATGSVYVTGFSSGLDFPTRNPIQSSKAGANDAVIAKMNASGTALVYSTYFGGTVDDAGYGIAVDNAGDAYVVGGTTSPNFPVFNPLQETYGGVADAFVTKLNPAGSALIYSTYLGGSDRDIGQEIAVDGGGNAYVTGIASSGNFPTHNPLQAANAGGQDAFVSKLNAGGSALIYSTYLGGSSDDAGNGIAVDSTGDAYVTGSTVSSNFPTHSPLQATSGGNSDCFVAKFNAAGVLIYSTYLGGSSDDAGNGIAVDSTGDAYVTGSTVSSNFPTHSPLQATSGGNSDCFVAKFNAAGVLIYSTYLGGSSDDAGNGIAVDSTGDAYVTGSTVSSNFPTHSPLQAVNAGGSYDAFVSKFNAAGTALAYSTYLGGTNVELGKGISVDSWGDAYIVGMSRSSDYPTINPLQSTNAGGADIVVSKIDPTGQTLLFSSYFGGSSDDFGYSIAINEGNEIYIGGVTYSDNFPTVNPEQLLFGGTDDGVIIKLSALPAPLTSTGVFRPSNGALYLKNSNNTGYADITLYYGQPGDQPVTGDWTGNGYRSIGVFRSGRFLLRNANTTGYADLAVYFGASGDLPVVGDWTGKGYDSVGVFRNGVWYLRNTNTTGGPDLTVYFGAAGDLPVVGDWTGKGYDSIGVYRPSTGTFYLRNTNTSGAPDIVVTFGASGDLPIAGDWTAKGYDSIGVYRNGTYFLRNSNTTGAPDITFTLGIAGDQPIAGPWLAPPGSAAGHGTPAPAHMSASHPVALPKGRQ